MWRLSRRVPAVLRGRQYSNEAPKAPKPAENTMRAPPPQAPPPPPPQRSGSAFGTFLKLLGLTGVAGGGLVGYSWYDEGFKKTVEDNVPYTKEAFDVLFQYLPEAQKPAQPLATLPKKIDTSTGPIMSDTEEAKRRGLAKTIKVNVEEVKKEEVVKKEPKEKSEEELRKLAEKEKEQERKRQQEEMVKQRLQEKAAEEAAENAALELILEEASMGATEVISRMILAYDEAVAATKIHAEQLRKAMDIQDEATNAQSEWEAVSKALDARSVAMVKVEQVSEDANMHLEKLKAAIQGGKENVITQKNKIINDVEQTLSKLRYNVQTAANKFDKALTDARMMEEFKDLVEKGREQFKKELESIRPDVKIGGRRGKKLTEDELNSLIAHAHRRIEQLQKQLAEQQALEQQRMEKAVDRQRTEDERLAEQQLDTELNRLKAQFELEKDVWDVEARGRFEQELRQQLARQAAAHSDHLAEVLRVQKQELINKFEGLLSQKLTLERDKFHTEIAGWISRLRGIESAIEARAEQEKQGRQAQELWLACQALQAALVMEEPEEKEWEEVLKPLEGDVTTIQKASNSHPFVTSIVGTIPGEALTRGVWPEEALKERFHKVQRVCRRVAMIDERGGSLFKYFVSYLQSFFIFSTVRAVSDDATVDMSSMNTFMLLDNAASCLERGDLEQAVRFINQLSGEPRRVAADWLKEARLLLETKMAADALLAHAAASGVGALQY